MVEIAIPREQVDVAGIGHGDAAGLFRYRQGHLRSILLPAGPVPSADWKGLSAVQASLSVVAGGPGPVGGVQGLQPVPDLGSILGARPAIGVPAA